MLYRVPQELDFLLPPRPAADSSDSQPWKGNLFWRGADNDPHQPELHLAFVHAVETEGDVKSQIWPKQLSLRTSRSGFPLANVHAWVKKVAPPLCMLMPGSNADPKINRANQNSFRSFAKLLRDRQIVAISRWSGPQCVPGSGIIIFPVEASDGLLAAAVFHSSPIPEFTPSERRQAYQSNYREEYQLQSPSSSLQPWSPNSQAPYSIPSPTYGNAPIWSTEPYSNSSYAVPRNHYLHLSISPLDLDLAQQPQFSSPLSSSDVPDFDWSKRQAPSSDIPEHLNYNLLSVADPDWSFLNSAFTLSNH